MIVQVVFFATSLKIGKKSWGLFEEYLEHVLRQRSQTGSLGALQGSSKGPRMTLTAENGQNDEGFAVVSFSNAVRRKILCQDTVIWCRRTKEKVRGPSGTYQRGP